MLGKQTEEAPKRKKGGGVVGIARIFLSLIMLSILGIVLYLALTGLSGQSGGVGDLRSIFTSQKMVDFAASLVTLSPREIIKKATDLFSPSSASKASSVSMSTNTAKPTFAYRFAVVSDSHSDNLMLAKALKLAKEADAKFVIGLGDFTNVGTIDELRNTKSEFDIANLPYYVTAGDHDLWDSRDKNLQAAQNFTEVFGSPYSLFKYQGTNFILMFNGDNYLGLDGVQLAWLDDALNQSSEKNTFVLTSTPLYHPSSDHFMGKTEQKVKNQAAELVDLFKKHNVSEVFAGDTHFYSRYTEAKTGLSMTAVGAVTTLRNLQAPRFVMVDVFGDGSYNIQDTEIK